MLSLARPRRCGSTHRLAASVRAFQARYPSSRKSKFPQSAAEASPVNWPSEDLAYSLPHMARDLTYQTHVDIRDQTLDHGTTSRLFCGLPKARSGSSMKPLYAELQVVGAARVIATR